LARPGAWLVPLRGRSRFAVAGLAGALGALGQAPVGLWPTTLLCLALVFGLGRAAPGWGAAFRLGLAAGTGYFALALSWIVEPFLVDAARHGWMAPFALVLLAMGMGLFWAVPLAVMRAAGGSAGAFVAAVVLAEALRTYAFTGFPWAQAGHALIDTPLLHWASWGGALGLTALLCAAAAGLWHLADGRWRAGLALLGLPGLLYAAGGPLTPGAAAPPDAPVIRLVQPNAPQEEKWDPARMRIFFERQIGFTAAPPDGVAPELVVWPETAVPWTLDRATPALAAISRAAGDTPVVLGIQRLDERRYFNALVTLTAGGEIGAVYDKHHLVPFGEYVPFGGYLKRFGIRGLAANDGNGYSPGPGPRVIELGALGTALPLICYEGVFPQDVGGYARRPDMLLLITNDAWFGRISGPYQHLAQARLRSAEQGLPMIRVANTGVSAMIDATGRVTARLPLGQAGWTDARLPPALPPTPYSRTGDAPIVGAALLLLLFCALRHARAGRPVRR
jgi:apolipoprotein N-acyltransferase